MPSFQSLFEKNVKVFTSNNTFFCTSTTTTPIHTGKILGDRFQNEVLDYILSRIIGSARAGSAQDHAGITMERFLSGLSLSALYFVFQILLFLVLREVYKPLYQGKVLLDPHKYTKNWVSTLWSRRMLTYQNEDDLDGIFFLRFLKTLTLSFLSLALLNVPILIPIHFLSSTEDALFSLDRLNMSSAPSSMLVVHLCLSILIVLGFHVLLVAEFKFVNPISIQRKKVEEYQTILLVNRSDKRISSMLKKFEAYGKHSKFILIPRHYSSIYRNWRGIHDIELTLEAIVLEIIMERFYSQGHPSSSLEIQAESGVVRWWKYWLTCCKFYVNMFRFKSKTFHRRLAVIASKYCTSIGCQMIRKSSGGGGDTTFYTDMQYLRLKNLLSSYRALVTNFEKQLTRVHNAEDGGRVNGEDFLDWFYVKFDSSLDAYTLGHLLKMSDKGTEDNLIIGPDPQDVLWSNLRCEKKWVVVLRMLIAHVLGAAIIIGWIIPVVLIGIIAQIPYLTSLFLTPLKNGTKHLKILNDMVISILPIITLIFLTEGVPYYFRLLSRMKGCKTGSQIEEDTQNWFFVFLFVHLFLVVTLSSGISFMIESLLINPTSIPELLGQELPKSSNFFCSFILIRGLSYSGGNLVRPLGLIMEIFYSNVMPYTPHTLFRRMKYSLQFGWGSIYPIFSVLGCIGIIYSIISPMILPICCIAFCLVYFSFKYLFEFQYCGEKRSGSYGKLYLKALLQLYAGIYFMEFCLLGLFTLYGQYKLSTTMLILFGLTIFGHTKISQLFSSYGNLVNEDLESKGCSNEKLPAHPTENKLMNYRYPGVDLTANFERIWVPRDAYGIVNREIAKLETEYDLLCDTSMYVLDKTGSVVFKGH